MSWKDSSSDIYIFKEFGFHKFAILAIYILARIYILAL